MDDDVRLNHGAEPVITADGMPACQQTIGAKPDNQAPMVLGATQTGSADHQPDPDTRPAFNLWADGPRPPALDPRLAEVEKV